MGYTGAPITEILRDADQFDRLCLTHIAQVLTSDPIAAAEQSTLFIKIDLALDIKRETDSAKCQCRLCWQLLVALKLTLRQALSYRPLDLSLGSHTQPFEKLSDAGVENVLVHHHLRTAIAAGIIALLLAQSTGIISLLKVSPGEIARTYRNAKSSCRIAATVAGVRCGGNNGR